MCLLQHMLLELMFLLTLSGPVASSSRPWYHEIDIAVERLHGLLRATQKDSTKGGEDRRGPQDI